MRKIALISFLLLAFLPCLNLQAQKAEKTNNLKIGFEVGNDEFWGSTKSLDRVRQSNPDPFDFQCGVSFPSQSMDISYVGAKSEYFLWNNRIGIAAGLRFSNYSSQFNSNKDYFLWRLSQENLTTDYVKIRDIAQNSYYLGIPLEVRFFPNNHDWFVQHYLKLGAVFNYRLSTTHRVNFQNAAMNRYEETVANQMEDPENFNVYIYPVIGLKIARCPWFNLEFHLPFAITNRKVSAFIQPDTGVGIQFSVQIPLGKTYRMGTED
jgi:hypothetical protein